MGAGAPIMFFCVWWPVDHFDDLAFRPAPTVATLDRETQTSSMATGWIKSSPDVGVVTGHHHLGALRSVTNTLSRRWCEVELRTVLLVNRRVPAALVLGQMVT